jgi:uncharacterized damage-inducible protein DinB
MPVTEQVADHSPYSATELESLCAFLDAHRDKILEALEGLDDADLRRRMLPSAMSLLGLVKHLGYIERWWFQIVFAGIDVPLAPHPDDEWRFEPDETTEDVISFYKGEVARGRELIAGATPETRAKSSGQTSRGPAAQFSLRWILLHMIEEVAQHNGHADIIRELLGAKTSVG